MEDGGETGARGSANNVGGAGEDGGAGSGIIAVGGGGPRYHQAGEKGGAAGAA